MKSIVICFLMLLYLSSCQNNKPISSKKMYDTFVFSYSAENANYSLKFQNNDTIYLQKRFPKPKENFYAVIQNKDDEKLDSFLKAIDFSKYDTIYFQNNLQDGSTYKFYLANDSTIKWNLIYGENGPKALYNFANWLMNLEDRQYFHPIDSTIDFRNLEYVALPDVPPPPKIRNSKISIY